MANHKSTTSSTSRTQRPAFVPPPIPPEGTFTYYDPITKDRPMYLDGQIVGFARTAQEAEDTLTELVHSILIHTQAESADLAATRDAAQALTDGEPIPFDLEAELLAERYAAA